MKHQVKLEITKRKTPHDTVELTTEQIAKIMAAGGSVKYS